MHGTIGLFGKIPAQGDFFRSNVADPGVQALVGWLQEAIEPVYRGALKLPASPVRFLFRAPGVPTVVVGAMAASTDKVGRTFPLCAFVTLPAGELGARYPAAPAAYRVFLAAASGLLAEAGRLDGPALAGRARELPLPVAGDLERADASLRREATEASGGDLSRRLFGDLPAGALAYALGTLEAAVKPVRGREPGRAALSLDCPAERDVDRWAWLELTRRSLGWPAPPSFFWTEGTPGRVVVALGGAPSGLLAHLCDPARPSAKVWPLRTSQPAAIETARRGLSPAAQRALDVPDLTVDALVAAVAA